MPSDCGRCGAGLDGPANHLELEVGAERGGTGDVLLDLCDGCADAVAEVARSGEPVVDLAQTHGDA